MVQAAPPTLANPRGTWLPFLLLVCWAPTAAALEFTPQEIPDLEVGPLNALTGQISGNFRLADFNGDGKMDLLLPRRLYFGADTGFAMDAPVAPPGVEEEAACDVWKDTLYLRTSQAWHVMRWADDHWAEQAVAPLVPPLPDPPQPRATPASGLKFRRFLYDIDASGTAEIVLVEDDGVHIYQLDKTRLVRLGVLHVLPPLTLGRMADQPLWPSDHRRLHYPPQQLDCRLVIEAASILVVTREEVAGGRARYGATPYRIDTATWTAFADQRDALQTRPLPAYMQPCRLNQDAVLDFAGGDWEISATRLSPAPIHHTVVSTDGGNTLQSVRSLSYAPQALFVDFDDDDDLDMITETTGLFRGGLRDALTRYATDRAVQHELAVYLQNASGQFSKQPDITAVFDIKLAQAPLQQGDMLRRYQAGELVNLTGDFNGDGFKDCAVRTGAHRLDIFLTESNRIQATPAATISVTAESWRFDVVQLNGDGRADVVIQTGTGPARVTTVYFAKEGPQP